MLLLLFPSNKHTPPTLTNTRAHIALFKAYTQVGIQIVYVDSTSYRSNPLYAGPLWSQLGLFISMPLSLCLKCLLYFLEKKRSNQFLGTLKTF